MSTVALMKTSSPQAASLVKSYLGESSFSGWGLAGFIWRLMLADGAFLGQLDWAAPHYPSVRAWMKFLKTGLFRSCETTLPRRQPLGFCQAALAHGRLCAVHQ